ncbi:MAG: hypothetical protein D6702_02120 [Planctomycetota bacterium]|nr:MAG: hypothetical protein D6702_02120 [Planctomycetota bacterium]
MVVVPPAPASGIRIVSGGQTGADRAALAVALEFGLACGGFCPRGRWAEDGTIPRCYPLMETDSADPAERTERNVQGSDATLIVTTRGLPLTGGTALTAELAERHGRPCLVVGGGEAAAAASRLRSFLDRHRIEVLNVAGPRASAEPEVGEFVRRILITALGLPEETQWSVWLLPAAGAAERLRAEIRRLADLEPFTVPFEPHLTLGSLPAGGANLAERMAAVEVAPFSLQPGPVRRGGTLARSKYLPFAPDPRLDALAAACGEAFGVPFGPVAEPHLSLCYGDPGDRTRLDPSWRIPFDRVRLARTSRPFHRPGQVAGWRVLEPAGEG